MSAEARSSIVAWQEEEGLANVLAPLALDVQQPAWPVAEVDALFCCNLVHISPWAASEGLFRGAARVLRAEAPLVLYGPFLRQGVVTAPSNLAFDANLRQQNPEWGVRSLEALEGLGAPLHLTLEQVFEMPSNNLTVVFRRRVFI